MMRCQRICVASRRQLTADFLYHRRYPIVVVSIRLRSTTSTTWSDAQEYYTAEQRKIMDKCRELHGSIMPLNEKLRGPLAPHSDRGTALPFVLLVGNHSSGKSSFINYLLNRPIQRAGVAPTDDSFTIIAPGPMDRDQDGPSLVGDPDLGFSSLRQFGPTLLHHTQLKIRKDIATNFILIDSPGMIDSPTPQHMAPPEQQQHEQHQHVMDRGYDFTGVVRWYADRADIVLLFFDPDKPGTTGETLSVLLHALSGMDHKLLIILNKADQFSKIHDFARAYGSLCWNLSKVIPRKDLPRIYTMCLPVAEAQTHLLQAGLQDLMHSRDEVVAEVKKAPQRRLDNVLTQLFDATSQLQMHARLLQDVRRQWSKQYWRGRRQQAGIVLTGGGLTAALGLSVGVPVQVTVGVLTAAMVGLGGSLWYHSNYLQEWEKHASSSHELADTFQRIYARPVSDGDEYVAALWQRVREPVRTAILQLGLGALPSVSVGDLDDLQRILDDEIPALRRLVSPPHYGKDLDDEVVVTSDAGSNNRATESIPTPRERIF